MKEQVAIVCFGCFNRNLPHRLKMPPQMGAGGHILSSSLVAESATLRPVSPSCYETES